MALISGSQTITTANLTDLLDGGASTLHSHAGGGIASVAADTTPQVGGSAGLDLQAQLLVGNGGTTGIAISANGDVTMAAQPCVLYQNSVSDTNVTGTGPYTVDLDTEIFDQNADFASDTFTAPIDGKYLVIARVRYSGGTGSADSRRLEMQASNRTVQFFDHQVANDIPIAADMQGSVIVDMDADDTVTIAFSIYGESSNVVDIYGQSGTTYLVTYISVHKIA